MPLESYQFYAYHLLMKNESKIKTTIIRPAATVTIIINGKSHKLSEKDARELYASLGKTLNIEPEKVYVQPKRNDPPWTWPAPPVTPKYIDPLLPYRNPMDPPYRITC